MKEYANFDDDKLLTESEVAEILRTKVSTIRYLRQTGRLRSIKFGRHPLVYRSVLEAFLKKASDPDTMSIAAKAKAGGKL